MAEEMPYLFKCNKNVRIAPIVGSENLIFCEAKIERRPCLVPISVYKHNASLTKEQGDLVKSGEVIAMAGNTGELTTGPHLHFELWNRGYPVNPTNFIDFN